MFSVRLIPSANIESTTHSKKWRSTSDDPHFIVLRKSYVPGRYFLLGHIWCPKNVDNLVKLYFDYGNGFTESQSLKVPVLQSGEFRAFIDIKPGCNKIRFDPLTKPATFFISHFFLYRFSTVKFLLAMLRHQYRLGGFVGSISSARRFFKLLSVREQRSLNSVLSERLPLAANSESLSDSIQQGYLFDQSDSNVLRGRYVAPHEHFPLDVPRNFHYEGGLIQPKAESIGVFVHAYYTDLIRDLAEQLSPVQEYVSLFVTTDSAEKVDLVHRTFAKHRFISLTVKVTPNRGRDIAPRFVGFSKELCSVDLALFIHTKKSPHIDVGDTWRSYLWEELFGSKHLFENILSIFAANPRLGMLAPHHWSELVKHQPINWGYNYSKARHLLERLGVSISADTPLDFPSGSMFWVRTAALKPLLSMPLVLEDFEEEGGQIDGTLAHTIERSLFLVCEAAGFVWAKYSTKSTPKTSKLPPDLTQLTLRLSGNEMGPSAVQRAFPETTRILLRPSLSTSPRLNLLVPTLRKKSVFGGLRTALTLFQQTALEFNKLRDCTLRIIVTDDTYDKSDEHESVDRFISNSLGLNTEVTVISVGERGVTLKDGIDLAEGDIFFASAWWNALAFQHFQEVQAAMFGRVSPSVYFVQDYEPGFYPWSSKSGLADSTYQCSYPIIHVINDEFLAEALHDFKFIDPLLLPFGLNDSLAKSLEQHKDEEKEDWIVFYGRPSVERNCFELILSALELWILRDPFASRRWKVFSVGEQYENDLLPPLLRPITTVLGKLTLDEYAQLLQRARVGISLMQSPHPSYPPQEMAAAGLAVVTNNWHAKQWSTRKGRYFAANLLTPQSVCAQLQEASSSLVCNDRPHLEKMPLQSEVNQIMSRKIVERLMAHLKV